MICSNCGADIGDNETACPYCGAMQYENSEQKYMKDLYNLNEGMEKLDKNTRKYIIKSTMKSVGIVCAAIAAAVLAGSMFGYGSYKSMYNSSHNRKYETGRWGTEYVDWGITYGIKSLLYFTIRMCRHRRFYNKNPFRVGTQSRIPDRREMWCLWIGIFYFPKAGLKITVLKNQDM